MLNRKIFRQLEQWLASGSKKAAFLDGARQVGKTTSVREFARRHFKYFVEVNFIKNPVARQAFDGNLDTRTIVRNLSVMGFGFSCYRQDCLRVERYCQSLRAIPM